MDVPSRRSPASALVALVAALAGCASSPTAPPGAPLLERARTTPSIVVVAQQAPVDTLFAAYARGYGEGAAKGAAVGAAGALQVALQLLAAGGAAGPAGLVLMGPVAGVALGAGVLAGAAIGVAQATPAEVAAVADSLSASLAASGAPAERVAEVVVEQAPRFAGYAAQMARPGDPPHASVAQWYGRLHEQGHAAALEVGVLAVGFVAAPGSGDVISLAVVAESRIVDLASARTEEARGIVYQSPAHTLADWKSDGGAVARTELARALHALGEATVDALLLRRERAVGFGAPQGDACGPAPRSPAPGWRPVAFSREYRPILATVASVTPQLEWEPLPRTVRRDAGTVRYDLRIWNERGDLVYERVALEESRHAVETALPPRSTLTWSVRGRYVVDGHARATPWSATASPRLVPSPVLLRGLWVATGDDPSRRTPCFESDLTPCGCLDFVPAPNRFAFQTP